MNGPDFSWRIRIGFAEICVGPPGWIFVDKCYSFWKFYIFFDGSPYGFGISKRQ